MTYFPESAESVPPVAERCPDPSEPSGRCRFSGHCSHQRNHQHIARLAGADLLGTCPWIAYFRPRIGYELPEEAQ